MHTPRGWVKYVRRDKRGRNDLGVIFDVYSNGKHVKVESFTNPIEFKKWSSSKKEEFWSRNMSFGPRAEGGLPMRAPGGRRLGTSKPKIPGVPKSLGDKLDRLMKNARFQNAQEPLWG